jgi:hypothetical protein
MSKPRVSLQNKIVVSLTTIPSRINELYYTLYSLMDQTYRVDQIIINIPYTSTKGIIYVIPTWLHELTKKCKFIILNRCEDEGPITKLTPTLRMFTEKVAIIIVDDDTIYKENTIEMLCKKSMNYPNAVITNTGYRMFNKDKTERKYHHIENMKHVDICMGYNGYLIYNTFFKEDWDLFYKQDYFFSIDDDCISLYLNKHVIPIYSHKNSTGLSLMKWCYLTKWIFNYNSDALSRNANKPMNSSIFTLYGEKEQTTLHKYGYYITDWSFINWIIL